MIILKTLESVEQTLKILDDKELKYEVFTKVTELESTYQFPDSPKHDRAKFNLCIMSEIGEFYFSEKVAYKDSELYNSFKDFFENSSFTSLDFKIPQ